MNAPASLLATLAVGFVLGLRHALDADHVVAVSTLVAREKNLWKSTSIGAIWGLGHTATLFGMGFLIIVLGFQIPASLSHWLEFGVAAMLIFLGARTLFQWRCGQGHFCTHQHGAHSHTHFHQKGAHQCGEEAIFTPNESAPHHSFWVGMVHGLSGSAELMLLVLATIRHPAWALTYIAIFGAGMIVAMFCLTGVFAFALRWTSGLQNSHWNRIDLKVRALTGAASLGFGCYLLSSLL